MALTKQIIRESGTYAQLVAGSGQPNEVQPGQMGMVTDRNNAMLTRQPGGNTNYMQLQVPVGVGAAGEILFLQANDQAQRDSDLVWDNTNKRFGVGVAAPEAKGHFEDGTAGAVTAVARSVVVVESDGDTYLSILSPYANVGGIVFGDPLDNDRGMLTFDHTSALYSFKGAGALTSILSLAASGIITPGDNVPIRAGGANGLILQEDGGKGATIEDSSGDLVMSDGHVRTAQAVVPGTAADTSVLHNGAASLSNWLQMQDSSGVVWYFPATSVAPT